MSNNASAPLAPACLGIVLDGNRRSAKAKGGTAQDGHLAGYYKFKEFLGWAKEAGVKAVIAYVFSTENWERDPVEVAFIMNLFRRALGEELDELHNKGVKVSVLGDMRRLPHDISELVRRAQRKTERNGAFHLGLAFSYGGRAEIVSAAKSFMAEWMNHRKSWSTLTEKDFEKHLWTAVAGFPDPDLILRPGVEKRPSNFLLWQRAYAEDIFLDTLWPDFTKEDFDGVLAEFSARKRRHGK